MSLVSQVKKQIVIGYLFIGVFVLIISWAMLDTTMSIKESEIIISYKRMDGKKLYVKSVDGSSFSFKDVDFSEIKIGGIYWIKYRGWTILEYKKLGSIDVISS